ncbi:hypothetical protein [Endozoicomonas lisbonensis]|uniref:Uncharacterized protein n=1 Tax=Endozoicomonas lisbonensis TaxID=3120522 RepID=A0ABV2SD04_9GAMM
MGYEDRVRKRHKFEASVREFLTYVVVMSLQEIELSIGRILDRSEESNSDEEHNNLVIKSLILQKYLELRKIGALKQKRIKNRILKNEMNYLFTTIGKEQHQIALLNYKKEIDKSTCIYNEKMAFYNDNLQYWNDEISKIPFWKKLFCIGQIPKKPVEPTYNKPSPPCTQEIYVEHSLQSASMSEFLIEHCARFWLHHAPLALNEYQESDIKSLFGF